MIFCFDFGMIIHSSQSAVYNLLSYKTLSLFEFLAFVPLGGLRIYLLFSPFLFNLNHCFTDNPKRGKVQKKVF